MDEQHDRLEEMARIADAIENRAERGLPWVRPQRASLSGMTPEDREYLLQQEAAQAQQLRKTRAALFPANVRPKLHPCDGCGQPSDVSADGGLCVGCEAGL